MIDHSMNLCQLSRLGFKGNIYMTDLTLQLVEHITSDGIKIHEKTVEYLNKSKKKKEPEVYPYMDIRSRELFLDKVRGYGFDRWISLTPEIRFKFLHSGHISGASMIYIEVSDGNGKETILYTGDTSCERSIPFTNKANIKGLVCNHIITESTYGGQIVPPKTENEMVKELYRIIKSTCIDKNGVVLIPSFAMARSTNLAYYIKKTYKKHPKLRDIPIYMVSPLMKKCHTTIGENPQDYDNKWKKEMDLFNWKNIIFITDYKEVVRIGNSKEPCIIISSAGMDVRGVNSFLLPIKVQDKNNTIAFVGYCAENTVGYKLTHGIIETMTYNIDGEISTVDVRANIENISGLSSHACGHEIVDMIATTDVSKIKNIIIVHGDLERGQALKRDFYNKFGNIDIHIPCKNQVVKL